MLFHCAIPCFDVIRATLLATHKEKNSEEKQKSFSLEDIYAEKKAHHEHDH
jgi:hypothetical protein